MGASLAASHHLARYKGGTWGVGGLTVKCGETVLPAHSGGSLLLLPVSNAVLRRPAVTRGVRTYYSTTPLVTNQVRRNAENKVAKKRVKFRLHAVEQPKKKRD